MTCHHVRLPDGGSAIICTGARYCQCGRKATLLCDWKVPDRKSGTCDKPVCDRCAVSPAPGKDLCPAHGADFQTWQAARESRAHG